jgi:hypothetical protein
VSAIRDAIRSALAVDTQLGNLSNGIFNDVGDPDVPLPHTVFHLQSPGEAILKFRDPFWQNQLWLVKGVSQDKEAAEEINERCKALLHRADLAIAGRKTLSLLIQTPDIDMTEQTEGEWYSHVGSIYRLVTETGV